MMAKTIRAVAAGTMLLAGACGQKSATDTNVTQAQAAVTATRHGNPARDWSKVVVATPEGGFRMGNPDAKLKLVEYASLTCPHCRDFYRESNTTLLRDYVAPGKISYEYRNLVLNGPDVAVTLLARCQGAPLFFKLADQLYDTQEQWIQSFVAMTPDDSKRLQALPKDQQIVGLADAGKIGDFFKLRGMTRAKYETCLKDQAAFLKLQDMAKVAQDKYGINGTPNFVFNDVTNHDVGTWPQVKTAIDTALR